MGVRTKLVVSAVLTLAALALIPAIGRAETSSEITYGPPSNLRSIPPGEHPRPAHPIKHRPKHTAPAPAESPEPTVEPETNEGRHPGAVAPSSGQKPPPGGAGNSHPHRADPPKTSPGSGRKPVANLSSGPTGTTLPGTDSSGSVSGGSSPVVPVLIAVAVLAALSLGVAAYRERSPLRR